MIHFDDRVTGAVLERYFESKGVGEECPMCSNGVLSISVFNPDNNFNIRPEDSLAVRVIHVLPDGTRRGYGEFLRVCPNCGFIHYTRDTEVLAFLDEEGDND